MEKLGVELRQEQKDCKQTVDKVEICFEPLKSAQKYILKNILTPILQTAGFIIFLVHILWWYNHSLLIIFNLNRKYYKQKHIVDSFLNKCYPKMMLMPFLSQANCLQTSHPSGDTRSRLLNKLTRHQLLATACCTLISLV